VVAGIGLLLSLGSCNESLNSLWLSFDLDSILKVSRCESVENGVIVTAGSENVVFYRWCSFDAFAWRMAVAGEVISCGL
jgi:hypothetical protein